MNDVRLNEKTWVPLGVVIAAIAVFASGAVWLNTALVRIDLRLQGLEQHHARSDGSWVTTGELFAWVQILEANNPTIVIPSISFDRR